MERRNVTAALCWLGILGVLGSGNVCGAQKGTAVKASADAIAKDGKVQAVIDDVEKRCRERTVYMIGPQKAACLAELVRQRKPACVVECGTAIGYSGLWIARELKALGKGKLISIEISQQRAEEAKQNFQRAGLSSLVEVRVGDAKKVVAQVKQPVDFLFIDCGYSNYLPCFQGIKARLTDGAVVVADNVGIGGNSMNDYLDLMRTRYSSRTEWFDLDLPWADRDAMEVTIYRREKPK